MIPDPTLWLLAGTLLLAAAAAALAALLRLSAAPGGPTGAALLAGIAAGLLAGPGVAGKAAPEPFQRAFIGGVDEHHALEQAQARHAREIAALREADVTETYLDELGARHAAEIAPLHAAVTEARDRRRDRIGAIAAGVVAAHCLLVGLLAAPLARAARRAFRRAPLPFSLSDAAGAAGLILVVAILTPVVATLWLTGATPPTAIAIGLTMAAPAIGLELRPRLLPVAAIGVVLAAGVAAWLAWPPTTVGVLLVAGVAAMILLTGLSPARPPRAARGAISLTLTGLTLPFVAAVATLRCDPTTLPASPTFWVVGVTALLLSSDARWAATAWAQRLFPRATGRSIPGARPWTGAGSLVNAGTGMAQLSLALLLEHARIITPHALAGIILGAAAIELTRAIRARVGWMLDNAPPPPHHRTG